MVPDLPFSRLSRSYLLAPPALRRLLEVPLVPDYPNLRKANSPSPSPNPPNETPGMETQPTLPAPGRTLLRPSLACVASAHLGAVAARLHRAPAAQVVAAGIQEQPVAIHAIALTDAPHIGRDLLAGAEQLYPQRPGRADQRSPVPRGRRRQDHQDQLILLL